MKRIVFPVLYLIIITILLLYAAFFSNKKKSFIIENTASYVNPFIGTDEHGHTHPAATLPFGMVQLGPDTRLDGWDGCSAYHYSDSIIYGFSHTHLSGTGCSDYGDILIFPSNSYNNDIKESKYCATFSHANEQAKAGYYSVVFDNKIKTELSVTQRVGFHKYTYPNDSDKYIIIDLEHRDKVLEAYIKQIDAKRFVGLRRSQAWANNQILYFVVEFSDDVQLIDYDGAKSDSINIISGDKCKVVLKSLSQNDTLLVKLALSAVSEESAINNLTNELPHWNFEKIKQEAEDKWNKELSKILVYGNDKENKEIFYTSLYHCFLAPNIYSDFDGSYRSTDLNIYKSSKYDTYSVFSLWDTYRATHPLFTITQVRRTLDFIHTFLDHYKYGKQLPVWELSANETDCMIGYHSVPVIVDAYLKGINEFDLDLALEAMLASSTEPRLGKTEFAEYGYIPLEKEHESVSKVLEYSYDDWCIAMFAKSLNKQEVYKQYLQRSQYYKNVFNPENLFMQARQNGAWQQPFDPKEVNFNYTEANSWQYSFYVPHDINSLIDLYGGNSNFEKQLDLLFSEESKTTGNNQADITGLIGQYAHGNEPSHHAAYLYSYCASPWKTQNIVRKIMKTLYSNKPNGLCGNEDCGQMSAWYVLSALGFYPINPANGIYDIGSPLFDTAIIQLENNNKFTIIAHNNSSNNIYIDKIELNGKNYDKNYIRHEDILRGSKLEMWMSDKPNLSRGTNENNIYNSRINEHLVTPTPYTSCQKFSFSDSLIIALKCADKNAQIFYKINNNDFIKYINPIVLKDSADLYVYAEAKDKIRSKTILSSYKKIKEKREIIIKSKYSPQYAAGGDEALIDYVKGANWFRSGLWQGYFAQDFEAIINLLEIKQINKINIRFLQDIKSWIFFPTKVSLYISSDNASFTKIADIDSKLPDNDYKILIQNYTYSEKPIKAKYVKIVAKNYGKLPMWHLSAGNDTWLFTDEVEIE